MRKFPAFIGEAPGKAIESLVRLLNKGPSEGFSAEAHANLSSLIREWQNSGNLFKMKLPPGCPNLLEIQKHCRVVLGPIGGRRAYYTIAYSPGRAWTAWDLACSYFIRVITDPECERFGGPCPRCGEYFLRKTAKPSIYCSDRHARQATAIKRTIEIRKERHADKLERAKKAQAEWMIQVKRARTTKPWKEWVVSRHPDMTIKFLTRAVTNGELASPDNERRKNVKTE